MFKFYYFRFNVNQVFLSWLYCLNELDKLFFLCNFFKFSKKKQILFELSKKLQKHLTFQSERLNVVTIFVKFN